MFPRFVAAPGFIARLTRFGNHVEAPFLVACFRVECGDVPADSIFAAAGSKMTLSFTTSGVTVNE